MTRWQMKFNKSLEYTKPTLHLAPIVVEINFVKVLNFDKVIETEIGNNVCKNN